jgi:hypothetical protein
MLVFLAQMKQGISGDIRAMMLSFEEARQTVHAII